MKVSEFYDTVRALLLATDQGKQDKVARYGDKLRQELKRIEVRKRNNYKLPWKV